MAGDKKPRFAHISRYHAAPKLLIRLPQGQVAQAAEQRLAAQNEQHHWAKKLLDEEKKLREAKEQLDVVQQEFEAS
jgi:hypothetical protein